MKTSSYLAGATESAPARALSWTNPQNASSALYPPSLGGPWNRTQFYSF